MTEGILKGLQGGKIDKNDVTSAIVDIAAIVSDVFGRAGLHDEL